ncbi:MULTISPECIES: alpha-amylase [unclassified Paenibacillus]|uniref:alpha-amylase n=1 Tax=unclassified Paenibacillus TaxID=185978 RepID=UPI000957257B|nr:MULTISPECIES: alpha-amylase [unclassified Paenibacillus]ASS67428.1 alpha-amylase [Paenibacillus sp. RUD330]SIQ77312.1 alpha-amylase [Paenibacillus sp. RU4X]SIQ98747.1 alpha-amylase [Paenibacillus sp. RU4T]
MERNHTMMQFFEWHVPADGRHWQRLKERSAELKAAGIDAVWIPPATKASSPEDNGYSIYDLYDLGEFDQKGAVRTKYGTKAELLEAIQACKQEGIAVYADLVMNHKAGADEKEKFKVVEVEGGNRQEEISDAHNIEGWTKFTFPGRGGKYSDFTWNFNHFNGTDFDAKRDATGVYRILGENKDWNENVDDQFGNYDYLMFANIDYNNPEVREEMIKWGKWLVKETGVDGFRLDAIKHIDHTFIRDFARALQEDQDGPFYIVGEFWNSIPEDCLAYLDAVESSVDLFDAPLHYRFKEAAQAGQGFDLRTIFDGSIVKERPLEAVTIVDNHDTQPGEALESWVDDWFKQSAYALILLRKDGYPVVFYGDYYGIGGEAPVEGKKMAIDPLLYARYHRAYGDQDDYFDDPNVIGWVRRGVQEFERSGCAVVVCNKEECSKRMFVGEERSGQVWVDLTNTRAERIVIGEDGFADFPVNGGSVSVWALPEFDVEPEGGE